jgi:CBS domain-containing protein
MVVLIPRPSTAWPSRLKIVLVARRDSTSPKIPVIEAVEMTVGEVMITNPKTLPVTVLVRDVRQVFEQPSHRTVLLTDDGTFRGAIERERLPTDAREDEPAARYADIQPLTVTPAMPMSEAIALLERRSEPRLIVLDEDGLSLRGLLCFNRTANGFCVR